VLFFFVNAYAEWFLFLLFKFQRFHILVCLLYSFSLRAFDDDFMTCMTRGFLRIMNLVDLLMVC